MDDQTIDSFGTPCSYMQVHSTQNFSSPQQAPVLNPVLLMKASGQTTAAAGNQTIMKAKQYVVCVYLVHNTEVM